MESSFKEMLKEDIVNVFFNLEEFGEIHTINRKEMCVIIDDSEQVEREKKREDSREWNQGIYERKTVLYAMGKDFGPLPAVGKSLLLDGAVYLITAAENEDGVYVISLEANRR